MNRSFYPYQQNPQNMQKMQIAMALRQAQKTINTANQILPLLYQVQPLLNNFNSLLHRNK